MTKIIDLDQPLNQSDLLSDGEIDKLIGSITSERYLARHCTHQEADLIIKAQLAKLISKGWKSPEEVEALLADERAKVLKEISEMGLIKSHNHPKKKGIMAVSCPRCTFDSIY